MALFPTYAIPFQSQKIIISAPSPIAVDAGKKISRRGGNVFDVAVVVALTLSVTSPYFAALGGGGFAMIKKTGQPVAALDFREVAPLKTDEKYYLTKSPESSLNGGSAIGVPGLPAGLYEIHKKYGKLPWSFLFNTPISLATHGFPVSGEWFKYTRKESVRFNSAGKKFFLKKGGKFYQPGDKFRQRQLVRALILFKDQKNKGFYQGPVAKDLVRSVQSAGGVLTKKDLKEYKVKWRTPLTTQVQGHTLHLMPLPSSGGLIIKTAFDLIQKKKVYEKPYLSVDEYHLIGEILKKSFRSRSILGDPDYNKPSPTKYLLSEKYIKKLSKSIKISSTKKMKPLKNKDIPQESLETTHFSVMDKKGNAIAMTITLNGNYGSAVVSEKYGIALNNQMDDFTTRPNEPNMFGLIQGQANKVQAGKRPLSSMSPTIVTKGDTAVIAIGAPGGPRIISGVFQTLYRLLYNNFDIERAIMAPRVHHQFLPDLLFVERNSFSPIFLKKLKRKGHQLKEMDYVAKVSGVRLNSEGFLEGASDFRGEGSAGGY